MEHDPFSFVEAAPQVGEVWISKSPDSAHGDNFKVLIKKAGLDQWFGLPDVIYLDLLGRSNWMYIAQFVRYYEKA
jgi:hypothetical protein